MIRRRTRTRTMRRRMIRKRTIPGFVLNKNIFPGQLLIFVETQFLLLQNNRLKV